MDNITNSNASQKTSQRKRSSVKPRRRLVAVRAIQDKQPDRTFYIRDKIQQVQRTMAALASDVYHSLSMTFSLDHFDFQQMTKMVWPTLASGVAYVMGNYAAKQLSYAYAENDDYEDVIKLAVGTVILGLSAANRLTEKKLESTTAISMAVASEVLAISNLYSSTFRSCRLLLDDKLTDSYSLIASLGASALAVPGTIAYLAQKYQERAVKRERVKGAQRSDTVVIPSGLTFITNTYLQANRFLVSELATVSRLFQLGLISDNILNSRKLLQQFRNLPALIADVAPAMMKKIIAQQDKIESDFRFNTAMQQVLRFNNHVPEFIEVPRYQLRNGDLVDCSKNIDLSSVPVSGELVAFRRDQKNNLTEELEQRNISINLKSHNGEDVWIAHKSKASLESNYKTVDLHTVHDGKQAGILVGDKLNLYGADNVFIQVMPEKEFNSISEYGKQSVINDIITNVKQRNVIYSALLSLVSAGLLYRDIAKLPAESVRLVFTLFQMMIPFSETFLREMVNSKLMEEINQPLHDHPLETIDALRITDLCNALAGYYHDRFPKGVAIVSDKTGTLTTTKMHPLGLWTTDMKSEVQFLLKNQLSYLMPEKRQQQDCFEVFAAAFTNNKKELEPEEHAILEMFHLLPMSDFHLSVKTKGKNHFVKTASFNGVEKIFETFHLGLYRKLGGRLTVVNENDKKYLVFCGVPKSDAFSGMSLLKAYASMQTRVGVLSRDWCIARTPISDEHFEQLKQAFYDDKKSAIENYLFAHSDLLESLQHYGTFIVDNPLKKAAEKFILNCRNSHVPVYIATGDTAKAAMNIAKVLSPSHSDNIILIHSNDAIDIHIDTMKDKILLQNSTVIFSGVNSFILNMLDQIMELDEMQRPVIIFSEMSTDDKGVLAQHLLQKGYFVVANGDGTNDVMMMKNAHMVIAHLTDELTYAPGVDQLANLSDKQLQLLSGTNNSFYELFDIHEPHSKFIQYFTSLANSQEKPSIALALKSCKMTFELAQAIGLPNVKEMAHQHWCSVGFDLAWLWITYRSITGTADLPVDNQHLGQSSLINQCMLTAIAVACLQSLSTYVITGESTNLSSMIAMLSLLPIVLKSIYTGYGAVQNELHPIVNVSEKKESQTKKQSILNYMGSFFSKKTVQSVDISDNLLEYKYGDNVTPSPR